MALDLNTVYPGQLDPSDPAGYPYGQARNLIVPEDGTGTPLERRWVNDLFGFQQALLTAAGIVPSGTPDKVGASQYLEALEAVIEAHDFSSLNVIGNAAIGTDAADLLTVQASTAINGPIEFNSEPAFTAGLEVVGGVSIFNGNVTLGTSASDVIAFGGGAAFFAEVGVLGAFHAVAADFAGLVAFNAGVVFNDPVQLNGDAHIRGRAIVGADANVTYGINDADVIIATSLTADRVWTLSSTGALDGAEITFTNESVLWQVTAGGTVLKNASGFSYSVTFVRLGGAWHVKSQDRRP